MYLPTDLILLLAWTLLVFAIVRVVGGRYLGRARSAWICAGLCAAAFLAGGLSPFAAWRSSSAQIAASSGATGSGQTEPTVLGTVQLQSACRGVRIANVTGEGALDTVLVVDGSIEIDRGAQPTFLRTEQLRMHGWAAADTFTRPVARVCAAVDGKVIVSARVLYGTTRPDLAEHFGNRGVLHAGFSADIPAGALPPGTHLLEAVEVAHDGELAGHLPGATTITVR